MIVEKIKFDSEKRVIFRFENDFLDYVAINDRYAALIALQLGYNSINDLFEAIEKMYGFQKTKQVFEIKTMSQLVYLS
jgi:hypothetical protein